MKDIFDINLMFLMKIKYIYKEIVEQNFIYYVKGKKKSGKKLNMHILM